MRGAARSKLQDDNGTDNNTSQFVGEYLPKLKNTLVSRIRKSVQTLSNAIPIENREKRILSVCMLANAIEDQLNKQFRYFEELVFIDSHGKPPSPHPRPNTSLPDVYVVRKSVALACKHADTPPAWAYLQSVGEWKSSALSRQRSSFGGFHNQARPDRPAVLFFTASKIGYVLAFSSPEGYFATNHIPWDDISPFIAYIHALHEPIVYYRDTTITLIPHASGNFSQPVTWRIDDEKRGVRNEECSLFWVGTANARMTAVFRSVSNPQLIIKDSFMDIDRIPESTNYEVLMDGGPAPGWVPVILPLDGDSVVSMDRANPFSAEKTRHKQRTVMTATGTPFSEIPSLKERIKVAYDALEASRWAISKRRLLHRDMSPANILAIPKGGTGGRDGACFIDGLYSNDPGSQSTAMLIDLDNSVKLPRTFLSLKDFDELIAGTEVKRALQAIVGTPMYIARTVSTAYYRNAQPPFPSFLALNEYLTLRYLSRYPNDELRCAQGGVGSMDKDAFTYAKARRRRPIHRPWHDAESILLVFAVSLLTARPLTYSEDTDITLPEMQQFYGKLRQHSVGDCVDPRMMLFDCDQASWRALLHPILAPFVPMLTAIFNDALADFEFLEPADGVNPELVLHEIIQRHLLAIYDELEHGAMTDVVFDITQPRPLLMPGDPYRQISAHIPGTDTIYSSQDSESVPSKRSRVDNHCSDESVASTSERASKKAKKSATGRRFPKAPLTASGGAPLRRSTRKLPPKK